MIYKNDSKDHNNRIDHRQKRDRLEHLDTLPGLWSWLIFSDSPEVQSFFAMQKKDYIYVSIIDENFSFFRLLEKELWHLVVIDQAIWHYLPDDTRQRLFDFRTRNEQTMLIYLVNFLNPRHAHYGKEIFAHDLSDNNTENKANLFHYYLFRDFAHSYLKNQLQIIQQSIIAQAMQKIQNHLISPVPHFSTLHGPSAKAETMRQAFNAARRSFQPLLIAGEKGSLTLDLARIVHTWLPGPNHGLCYWDMSLLSPMVQNISPPLDFIMAGVKTIAIPLDLINEAQLPGFLYQWQPYFAKLSKQRVKLIFLWESPDKKNAQDTQAFTESVGIAETLIIPPLRERTMDLQELIQYNYLAYLKNKAIRYKSNDPLVLSQNALDSLKKSHWPGNYNQLLAYISFWIGLERKKININDLMPSMVEPQKEWDFIFQSMQIPEQGIQWEQIERELLKKAYLQSSKSIAKGARLVQLGRKAFEYRLRKYGILDT